MLTIVLTYRNRPVTIVKRCLETLADQSDVDFKLFLVDYGSDETFARNIQDLVIKFSFVKYIYVKSNGQQWNKSRAINIALKKCVTEYFLMGDIDLLYHPNMVSQCKNLIKTHDSVYFRYGFLSEDETKQEKSFFEYEPEFLGNEEVTGTTLYKTSILKAINGYDEFYHGWGAEDTDVHLRLKNAGYNTYFYKDEILIKHQWHPKTYRSKKSSAPFHSRLEQVNHDYMQFNYDAGISVANTIYDWGIIPSEDQVERLQFPETNVEITLEKRKFEAFVFGAFPQLKTSISLTVCTEPKALSLKNTVKKFLKKKHFEAYTLEEANNLLLSVIITNHRLASYTYKIDWNKNKIYLNLAPYV